MNQLKPNEIPLIRFPADVTSSMPEQIHGSWPERKDAKNDSPREQRPAPPRPADKPEPVPA